MSKTIEARNVHGTPLRIGIASIPDECPVCHYKINPEIVAFRVAGMDQRYPVHGVFQCTRPVCQACFIGIYQHLGTQAHFEPTGRTHRLRKCVPVTPQPATVPQIVGDISPRFAKVYTQALAAEDFSLDELTGIGLRKALEFLIKDYSKSEHPEDSDQIDKTWLMSCIKNYVDDAKIKACAKRAAWLGNDETHYLRKFTDNDVEDLKILIRLTVNWIESALLTKGYEDHMPEGG